MKFIPTVDIWDIDRDNLNSTLQRGQWVRAGEGGPIGRFYGVKRSGIVVVAWNDNARGSGDYHEYQRLHLNYAKG